MEEVKTKKCGHCGREMPVEMFHKSSKSKDGLQSICKPCSNELTRLSAQRRKAAKEQARLAAQRAVDLSPSIGAMKVTDPQTGKTFTKVEKVKELKDYTGTELFAELKRRGYKWPDNTIYMKMYVNYDKIEI